MSENKKINKKQIVYIAVACVCIIALVISGTILLKDRFGGRENEKVLSTYIVSVTSTEEDVEYPDNPIDFPALQAKNTDICAWICVPDTEINYPVLQSADGDDSFYLNHDMDKKSFKAGSIYIESVNSNNFSDPNTVIYGHNMRNGSMFHGIHSFKDKAYFDAHETIYIYTPGHILEYKIFSCHRYDNRHIMNSFNFYDKEVFEKYLQDSAHPKSAIVNTREVPLTTDDRIITMSTCIDSNHNYRLLLQAVLISDTLTK